MTIPLTCGQCGKTMQVPERMAGRQGKCPGCGHRLVCREGFAAEVTGIRDGACARCGRASDILP